MTQYSTPEAGERRRSTRAGGRVEAVRDRRRQVMGNSGDIIRDFSTHTGSGGIVLPWSFGARLLRFQCATSYLLQLLHKLLAAQRTTGSIVQSQRF